MANELRGGCPPGRDGEGTPVSPGIARWVTGFFSQRRSNQMRAQDTRRDDQPMTTTLSHSNSALPAYTSEQTSLTQPNIIPPSPVGNSLLDGPYTVGENDSTSSGSLGFPFTNEGNRTSDSVKSTNEELLERIAEKAQWRSKMDELSQLMLLQISCDKREEVCKKMKGFIFNDTINLETCINAAESFIRDAYLDRPQRRIKTATNDVIASATQRALNNIETATNDVIASATQRALNNIPENEQAQMSPVVETAIPLKGNSSDWKRHLSADTIIKWNEFGEKKHKAIKDKINAFANVSTLEDTVDYATSHIEKQYLRRFSGSVASSVDSRSSRKAYPSRANDDVSMTSSIDSKQVPPVTHVVVEPPKTNHPPLTPESVAGGSDGNSELKETLEAFKEGLQATVEKMGEMSKENIKGMNDMQQNNMTLIQKVLNDQNKVKKLGYGEQEKQLYSQKAEDFESIPDVRDAKTIPQWRKDIARKLNLDPWTIEGTSILEMTGNGLTSEEYKNRVSHLCGILIKLLNNAGLKDCLNALESTMNLNNGVKLLDAITNYLMPLTTTEILSCITDLCECIQGNGESIDTYKARFDNIWTRISALECDTVEILKLSFLQRGIFDGPYTKGSEGLEFLKKKIDHGDTSLRKWDKAATPEKAFLEEIRKVFTLDKTIASGVMMPVPVTQHFGRAAGGTTTSSNSHFASAPFLCTGITTKEDVMEMFKWTNCLFCRYPKDHPNSLHMTACEHKESVGLIMRYIREMDERREDHEKLAASNKKRLEKHAMDKLKEKIAKDEVKKVAELEKKAEKEKSLAAARLAAAKKDDLTVVGKDGKDVKSDAEETAAINNNLQQQSEQAGAGRRITIGAGRMSCFKADGDDNGWTDVDRVDAGTAVNDISNDTDPYFRSVLRSVLSAYDRTDRNGNLHRCVSVARHAPTNKSFKRFEIVVDTGATAHMRRYKEDFEIDSYVQCENTFVCMGDGSEIPVLGYGTSRMKINGKVVRLTNSLHVPNLDCDLFSGTRHGRNGEGCSLLLAENQMHLTFPNFVFTQDIPRDNDLKIKSQPLSDADWALPPQMCDCGSIHNYQLDDFSERLDYLNEIFKNRHAGRVMTRAQRQKQAEDLKRVLGIQNDESENPLNKPERESIPKNDLPDRYTYEGNPDADLLQILKEMNIHDIKDFINDNEHFAQDEKDEQFTKDDRPPPPQYHLESSRGEVKDRVTANDLQTHFGGRKLKDFSLLSKLGTGISIINNVNEIPTVGELVNRKRGKRRRKGTRATAPLEVVGMDIGYGDGVSVGGSKYVLVLVDQCTTGTFVYGMQGSSGGDVCEALWKFFIDAGGFPKILQCDFDPRLIGGRAAALLRSHGTRLRAAPPGRQDFNGLVERKWQSLTAMARSFLADAKLPKKFWFWAIREAALRSNILPISQKGNDLKDPEHWSTPHFEFYGEKPDYRILFHFGAIGAFRRARDGNYARTNYDS